MSRMVVLHHDRLATEVAFICLAAAVSELRESLQLHQQRHDLIVRLDEDLFEVGVFVQAPEEHSVDVELEYASPMIDYYLIVHRHERKGLHHSDGALYIEFECVDKLCSILGSISVELLELLPAVTVLENYHWVGCEYDSLHYRFSIRSVEPPTPPSSFVEGWN